MLLNHKARIIFVTAFAILALIPTATTASSVPSEDRFEQFFGIVDHYLEAGELDPSLSTLTLDVRVWKSTDGGLTFNNSVVVAEGSRSIFHDKPFIAVDPADPDNVYVSWTRFTFESDTDYSEIVLSRSTDGGQTWSELIEITPQRFAYPRVVQGSMPAVGPDGTVYVAYYDSLEDGWLTGDFSPMIAKSSNGETFSAPKVIATMPEMDFDMPPTTFRAWASMLPIIAVDPIDSDYVYSVFTAYNGIYAEDVFFSRSQNGGNTWSVPLWVNDDDTSNSQFFPSITVTPDREIHIIWGDRRDDPDNYLYNVYYDSVPFAGPFNGGLGTDEKISETQSDPTVQNPIYIGDYFDIASTSTNDVFVVWTDTRNDGDQDIYFAESPDFDNMRVNQDPITRLGFSMQNDPSIAVNPEDPDNIVVGAHDSRDRFGEAWYYASIDGGETWIEGSLPGIESINLLSDPTVAFGLDDTVYYSTIATELADLTITPDSGSIGASIEIEATGFDPFTTVLIMFDDQSLGFRISNAVGAVVTTIQVPSLQPGTHVIKVTDGYASAEESFSLIDTTPMSVSVDAGSNLFRGETARLYARTTLNGQPIDVTSVSANLYLPDGTSSALAVQRIGTGLYVAIYNIPTNAPFGTYLAVFNAQISDSNTQTTGSSSSSFAISDWVGDLRILATYQYLTIIMATILVIIALVFAYLSLKQLIVKVASERPIAPAPEQYP